jgi:hypothetical protein
VEVPSTGLHNLLNVIHSSKLTTYEVEFEFQEKEKVTRTEIRHVWGLRNHWKNLFGQNFVHGDKNVTRSIVVIQYPSVHMPNSLVKMSWIVW